MNKASKQIKDLKEIVGLTVRGVSNEFHDDELLITFTNGSHLYVIIDYDYGDTDATLDLYPSNSRLYREPIAVEAGLITEEQRKLNKLQYQITQNKKANEERRMLYQQLRAEFEEKEYTTFTPDGVSEDE